MANSTPMYEKSREEEKTMTTYKKLLRYHEGFKYLKKKLIANLPRNAYINVDNCHGLEALLEIILMLRFLVYLIKINKHEKLFAKIFRYYLNMISCYCDGRNEETEEIEEKNVWKDLKPSNPYIVLSYNGVISFTGKRSDLINSLKNNLESLIPPVLMCFGSEDDEEDEDAAINEQAKTELEDGFVNVFNYGEFRKLIEKFIKKPNNDGKFF
jgi:hypothetical protein